MNFHELSTKDIGVSKDWCDKLYYSINSNQKTFPKISLTVPITEHKRKTSRTSQNEVLIVLLNHHALNPDPEAQLSHYLHQPSTHLANVLDRIGLSGLESRADSGRLGILKKNKQINKMQMESYFIPCHPQRDKHHKLRASLIAIVGRLTEEKP